MVHLDFKTKKNGMPVLSKKDIEELAEIIISDYKPDMIDKAKALDVEHFLEFYADLQMDYQDLTHNQSILGMMVFNDGHVPVYDANNNKAKMIPVDEGTVLIDNSLLNEEQLPRERFTLAHEVGHWLLHRQMYVIDKNQISLFDNMPDERATAIKCRKCDIESTGRKNLLTDDDWMEWQADYLASALLMPKKSFINEIILHAKEAGMYQYVYDLGIDPKYSAWVDNVITKVAGTFEVSLTAAIIRINNLGFGVSKQYSIL